MSDLWNVFAEHWFWITMTGLLMITAFLQGHLIALRKHRADLQEFVDWLQGRNDFWLELFGDVGTALAANRAEKESRE